MTTDPKELKTALEKANGDIMLVYLQKKCSKSAPLPLESTTQPTSSTSTSSVQATPRRQSSAEKTQDKLGETKKESTSAKAGLSSRWQKESKERSERLKKVMQEGLLERGFMERELLLSAFKKKKKESGGEATSRRGKGRQRRDDAFSATDDDSSGNEHK